MVKGMRTIEETIQRFDQSIEAAHEQISGIVREISNVDEHIRSAILEFKTAIDGLSVQESNLFEKELAALLEQYKENCERWCQAVNDMVEGKDFISQFEKSILIVVFGNVNVGKSSVGNIIAGTVDWSRKEACEQDRDVLKKFFGEPPVFYEYDLSDGNRCKRPKKKEDSFFKEGCIETTANIQYFTRKNGMTWTDSPGIGSVNQANGELAKKYVDFADLVIFITTSSSPGKLDELMELECLFGKKKPCLILLNKSDRIEKDEVDGEIVSRLIPKSQADREKQEEYVKVQFRRQTDKISSDIDALSISVYLAMEAFRESDAEKFEQSGFPEFYGKLGKLFEKNAVDLKMNAPRQRVNAAIDEIICGGHMGAKAVMGIRQFRQHLMDMKEDAEKMKKEIGRTAKKSISAILQESMARITAFVQEQAHQVRKSGADIVLGQEIDRIVTEVTAKVLEREMQEVLTDYNHMMTEQKAYHSEGEFSLSARKEQVDRYVYDVKEVRRNPDGLLEHVEHWLFKKEFTRNEIKKRRITETFVNGDNSAEMLERIRHETGTVIKGYVRDFVQNVQEQYFRQEEILIGKILDMLQQLAEKLEEEKMQ